MGHITLINVPVRKRYCAWISAEGNRWPKIKKRGGEVTKVTDKVPDQGCPSIHTKGE